MEDYKEKYEELLAMVIEKTNIIRSYKEYYEKRFNETDDNSRLQYYGEYMAYTFANSLLRDICENETKLSTEEH